MRAKGCGRPPESMFHPSCTGSSAVRGPMILYKSLMRHGKQLVRTARAHHGCYLCTEQLTFRLTQTSSTAYSTMQQKGLYVFLAA